MREVPFCIADLCLSHCASADVRVSVSYLAVHYLGAFSGFYHMQRVGKSQEWLKGSGSVSEIDLQI